MKTKTPWLLVIDEASICTVKCSHADCAEIRNITKAVCHVCQKPLGHMAKWNIDAKGNPQHTACGWTKIVTSLKSSSRKNTA